MTQIQPQRQRRRRRPRRRRRILHVLQASSLIPAFMVHGGSAEPAFADEQLTHDAAAADTTTTTTTTKGSHTDDTTYSSFSSCINHHNLPMEPDVGCSPDKPLCVQATAAPADSSSASSNHLFLFQRPLPGQAGNMCMPYPCHATSRNANQIDAGCTADKPVCVDALQRRPARRGQAGVECVQAVAANELNDAAAMYRSQSETTATTTPAWDKSSNRETSSNETPSVLWGTTVQPGNNDDLPTKNNHRHDETLTAAATTTTKNPLAACSSSAKAGMFTFCTTCPFGSSTRTGKSCELSDSSSSSKALDW